MCNSREKWKIKFTIWHALIHLNLRSFTISVKSRVVFRCSDITWPAPDSFFVCLMKIGVRIVLLTRILVILKTMSKKFHGLYAKSFCDSAKDRYFLKFRNGKRNVREENYFSLLSKQSYNITTDFTQENIVVPRFAIITPICNSCFNS